ncbi:MAG: hypothetical protein J6R68_01810 [Clostridia bacterium]|nr:hypothetical protein [Clostridia bacterium]
MAEKLSIYDEFKDKSIFRNSPDFDINMMYERVFEELTLQQSKRDQLITIYLAAIAFVVPALLKETNNNWSLNGYIFMALGLIGFLFALIIIRYRKYKEVYWICCRTLNVMMDIDKSLWNKEMIQKIFFNCMMKKIGKKYITPDNKFRNILYIRKNFFSGETLYLVIHAIISGMIFGLGSGMVLPFGMSLNTILGAICGLMVFGFAVGIYYGTLIKLYRVCIVKNDTAFNYAFGDAWFLHFFI